MQRTDRRLVSGMRSGAGGFWRTINERMDENVPAQTDPLGCVAATGAMLLKARGLKMPQEQILAKIGILANPRALAEFLNEIDVSSEGKWQGLIIEPDESARNFLNRRGAWGTAFREGSPIGHFVMVAGVNREGRLLIRDPFPLKHDDPFGTSYEMEVEEFMRVWSGEVVFYGE